MRWFRFFARAHIPALQEGSRGVQRIVEEFGVLDSSSRQAYNPAAGVS
jgi:hypothetical protein